MSGPPNEYVNIRHTRLHGGWLLYKTQTENKWQEIWAVLRDSILFFFSNENTCLETHIGTLQLSSDSRFHMREGDLKTGFKFDLQTAKRKNKFKAKTLYEREVWRVYVEGVISGKMPESIILNPRELAEIHDRLFKVKHIPSPHNAPGGFSVQMSPQAVQSSYLVPSPGPANSFPERMRRGSVPSINSGCSGGSDSGGGFDPPQESLSQFSADSGSGGSQHMDPGGPFMHHKFNPVDHHGDPSEQPPWFFANCSRELACRILSECSAAGNTLMRESLSARDNGSYAISKRMERTGEITHYEVIRVAEGYRINVENSHKPMRTLSEVMDFFSRLSGPATTHPMKTNNLKELGVEYAAYTQRIPQMVYDEDSGEGDNVSLSYEIPMTERAPPPPVATPPVSAPPAPPAPAMVPPAPRGPAGPNNTWSSKKHQSFNEGGPRGNKTMGPGGSRFSDPRMASSMAELQQRLAEQCVMQNLDKMLDTEEKAAPVASPAARASGDVPPPLPPVPSNRPKLDASGHPVYVNQLDLGGHHQPAYSDIPHPRWNKRAQSVPIAFMDANVPHSQSAPSMVLMGRKAAPAVAPKTTKRHHMSVSSDEGGDSAASASGQGGIQPLTDSQNSTRVLSEGNLQNVGNQFSGQGGARTSSLVQELQAKLQLGQSALRHVDRDANNRNPSSQDGAGKRTSALSGKQTSSSSGGNDGADDADDYYEDINQYENMRPRK